MTLSIEDLHALAGGPVLDPEGAVIGELVEVYLDEATREPEWAVVDIGLVGARHAVVPLLDATLEDGALRVAFDKALVRDSPPLETTDAGLTMAAEERLCEHYGLAYHVGGSPSGLPGDPEPEPDHDAEPASEPASAGNATSRAEDGAG